MMPLSRRSFVRLSAAAALAPLFPSRPVDNALCRKLASDPLRPQYHLMPAHNWMNDPNGPIYFGGRYHMFHQYNPQAAVWGNMNWAHGSSPDLIHWQHEPIAISPTPNGPDRDGVFSGSAVLDHGRPTVIYTGVAPPASASEVTLRDGNHTWRETQCLAVAQDNGLRTWKKVSDPVIAAPPDGLKVTGFRDPVMWREDDRWVLALGSGTRERGGMVLLYASQDLRHWTYLHPLVEGSPSGKNAANVVDSGDMWECPDFFPLEDKHVLVISTMGKVGWKVGSYSNQRFTPEKEGIVDWGAYYAAKTMVDKNGGRILWGWIPETRPDADLIAAGWAGVMSLPRVLSLSAENELQTAVSPAAHSLRDKQKWWHSGTRQRSDRPLETSHPERSFDELRISGLAAELDLLLHLRGDAFSLRLQSEDGTNFATILFEERSGHPALRVNEVVASLPRVVLPELRLHVFLDGSVLEVFANAGTALTARVYKVPAGPLQVKVDGAADIVSAEVWQMKPISSDRLTGSLCS